jgi:hypothetical protein
MNTTLKVTPGQQYKVARDGITRGATVMRVRRGTVVEVLATRQDDDGLKALVRIGEHGGAFQIRADALEATDNG